MVIQQRFKFYLDFRVIAFGLSFFIAAFGLSSTFYDVMFFVILLCCFICVGAIQIRKTYSIS